MEPVISTTHIPRRVWQQRPGEISWKCSCGASNTHVSLPADLECEYDDRPRPELRRILRNVTSTYLDPTKYHDDK